MIFESGDAKGELLPCPFCGRSSHCVSSVHDEDDGTKQVAWIECDKCEARGPSVTFSTSISWEVRMAAASANWNVRAPPLYDAKAYIADKRVEVHGGEADWTVYIESGSWGTVCEDGKTLAEALANLLQKIDTQK